MTMPHRVPAEAEIRIERRQVEFSGDPRLLWDLAPEEPAFLWSRGSEEMIVSSGVAQGFEAAGPDRFREIAARLSRADLPRPLLVGGFAFDPAHAPAGEWSDFASLSFHLPRVAILLRPGRTELFAASADTAQSPGEVLDALEENLTQLVCRPKRTRSSLDLHVRARETDAEWQRSVSGALAEIESGQLEKLVLSRAVRVSSVEEFHVPRLTRHLSRAHPHANVFAVRRNGSTFLGASPETLACVENRELRTAAVAGTARRGDGASEEVAAAETLQTSVKERHEHQLVVADVVERIAPFCDQVKAEKTPETMSAGPVQHLRTPIRGTLLDDATFLDVVATLHPTPALGGLPRAEVASALNRHESSPRGWYGGGIGWMDGADGEISVAIRTALVRSGEATLHAGAGIVAGSEWTGELEETRLKMRTILEAFLEA
ncbi:MAG: isochorismate synthase [Candidatus Binatia bacterium]|nr:isochorismate synthase [Candidatus Binatia bacterium]MDG2010495.1 isochorismate synthase [Candidatus Binatia bacterium]